MSESIKIKRMIQEGEFGDQAETSRDILANGGAFLDHVVSDYTPTLFEGEDGKFYVATVEVVIEEANPEYVEDILGNMGCDEGEHTFEKDDNGYTCTTCGLSIDKDDYFAPLGPECIVVHDHTDGTCEYEVKE